MRTYITVAIPYVNADPHLGYAYELIEADLAARARRLLGEEVRFLGGTDEYSLKNVLAAAAAGEATRRYVDRHADAFAALAEPLGITFDDFIRTSRDPRHQPAVERLWRACADRGDLYSRDYSGSYCVGCEQFYDAAELVDGRCRDHGDAVETVTEANWFFRLSRYTDQLIELIESDELRITPSPFRTEILAFLRRGLDDISVSRSAHRARGWGIPVPDDPTQVVYVWFDALTNYISALGYGDDDDDELYRRWWRGSDDRIHVVGKGITRFHAVYWPAFLLSAGEPIPTRIQVHPYLSLDGAKLSKSSGSNVSPTDIADRYGADALRWWITSDVNPVSDTDFTLERLVTTANETLANGFGNAVNRVTTLRHRHPRTRRPGPSRAVGTTAEIAADVAAALADFDRRTATQLIVDDIVRLNQRIEADRPWALARRPEADQQLADLLADYLATLHDIAQALAPITPALSARVLAHLDADPAGPPQPVFVRLDGPSDHAIR